MTPKPWRISGVAMPVTNPPRACALCASAEASGLGSGSEKEGFPFFGGGAGGGGCCPAEGF